MSLRFFSSYAALSAALFTAGCSGQITFTPNLDGGQPPSPDGGHHPVAPPTPSDAGVTPPSAQDASGGPETPPAGGDLDRPPPPSRGAPVPYWEYEAEDPAAASTTGTILPPTRTFGEVAAEASGRSAVRLDSAGQNVTFTLKHRANAIVVRYSIPDAPGGANATLGLYVNGVRKGDLKLTSRYSWTYGDADAQNLNSENPGNGTPHHFYDEVHALMDEVGPGTKIALQRDAQDTAQSYVIDLVDFEEVDPPANAPQNSISITDFGATADDGTDDSAAIQKAIDTAKASGKEVFIPRGVFEGAPKPAGKPWPKINVSDVTIRGAGMWHSVIHGFGAQFQVSGNNNRFYDFAVFGDITYRDDEQGWQGFDGPAGTGSRMENVWIEHETVGWWVGKGALIGAVTKPLTDGLVVHGVRIRDTYADGVNFANATSNSVVEESSFRNTGDDSIATWSYAADGPIPCKNDTFRFNTVQAVWRANCLAIYGGSDHKFQDNVCSDTSNYPGLLVSTTFNAIPFGGSTSLERNTLIRAGGPHYNQQFGALRFFADTASISNVTAKDISIESPTYSGVHFGGANQSSGIALDGIYVKEYGTVGILVSSEAHGNAQFDNVTVEGQSNKGLQNDSNNAYSIQKGAGNNGW